MKKWVIFFLTLAIPFNFALYHTHIKRTKGFSIDKITPYPHKPDPIWRVSYTDQELQTIESILKQPFTYFGSGKTCYVFLSHDQNYVIKLFKQRHMRPFSFFEKLAGFDLIPFCKAQLKQRLNERRRLFTSFKIAQTHLKNETGLVYLHLQPTNYLHQMLYFTDKEGHPFTFDADRMEFLIQKKAERTFPSLSRMIENGEIEKAKNALQSIQDLIISRCEKGIDDDDNNCERNIALLDGRAIEIDIGEFTYNPNITPAQTKKHIEIAVYDLHQFLKQNHPEFYESIQNPR